LLPALVGGSIEEARLYLSRRYGTEFSSHAVERYCLVGSPERCAERAREYLAAGAEHLVFNPAVEPGRVAGQIESLAGVADAAAR
jgi:alkanesulfonate monooxygenase SsuD/methylene tetrahydromethanopterin reductase-like flavin-dependent oxidoreductase (luciferase family)